MPILALICNQPVRADSTVQTCFESFRESVPSSIAADIAEAKESAEHWTVPATAMLVLLQPCAGYHPGEVLPVRLSTFRPAEPRHFKG